MSAAHASPAPAARPLRQAVLVKPGQLELRDFAPVPPAAGELLIRVVCALSCGTDLKAFRRGHPMWKLPTPFGHEFAGVVEEAGRGVTAFKRGDEIMAAPTAPCGSCFYCLRGQENLCALAMDKMVMGGYADALVLPAHVVACNTFAKPADLPFEEAALLEPLSCVVHAQDLARPEKHETALIVGAGVWPAPHARTSRGGRPPGGSRRAWPQASRLGARAWRGSRDRCDGRRCRRRGREAQRRFRPRSRHRMHRANRRLARRVCAGTPRRQGGVLWRMSAGHRTFCRHPPDALRQPDLACAVSLPSA